MTEAVAKQIRELKFYDDTNMRGVREAFESTVLKWPGVSRKEMMGCLVYFRGRKMFAFLVTDGLVIMKLSEADRTALAELPGARPFEMSGQRSSRMIQSRASKPAELSALVPYVRSGYEACGP